MVGGVGANVYYITTRKKCKLKILKGESVEGQILLENYIKLLPLNTLPAELQEVLIGID